MIKSSYSSNRLLQMDGTSEKNFKPFITVVFLYSVFYYFGQIGKNLEEYIGILLVPFLVILAYIFFIGKLTFNYKNIIMSFIVILGIVLSYIIVGGGIGSVVNNISSVLYILIFSEVDFDNSEYKYFCKLIIAFQVYLICYILLNGLHDGYIGIYNSNTIGSQLLFNLVYMDMYIDRRKKGRIVVINLVSLLMIFFTRSRTPLVAGLFIVIFLIINHKMIIKPWLLKLGFWGMSAIGILFPIFYGILYLNYSSLTTMAINSWFIEHFNKSIFTGREFIWGEAIRLFTEDKKKLIFGIGSHYLEGSDGNFHNSYLSIMICCGLITYVFFIIFLYSFFKKGNFETREIQRSRLFYIAIMIIGISESTLFAGLFSIMPYMLLCSSNSFINEEEWLIS